MSLSHPKSIRRRLLLMLYERYVSDPLEMLGPDDFLNGLGLSRQELIVNVHYLADRKLVELLLGYNPPLFAAARITADGIDMVENRFEFDLRFPPDLSERDGTEEDILWLMERLMEEAEFSPLDGEARKNLLRDAQYLREELARPVHRWRRNVISAVLGWIEQSQDKPEETLPSLAVLCKRIAQTVE
jgi:hypothetical protein